MRFNELKYQHPATRTYLGSPSLVRVDNGDLLASHDYFGPGSPRDHEGKEHLTSIYRSCDDGQTWVLVNHIAGAFWSNLFLHQGSIYLFGVSSHYGSIVIRRSNDGGSTWTHPMNEKTGLLFHGGPYKELPNYHCAPMPVLNHCRRLYRAFEDCAPCIWGVGFRALVISADENADLLDASNWRMSNALAYDPNWAPESWDALPCPGWLEGNMVETPDGKLWNILRFNSEPLVDRAAIVQVDESGQILSFDSREGFINLPGGMSKFTIRRDPQTGVYFTISNNNTDPTHPRQRNVLSLYASEDLVHWQHKRTLLKDDSHLSWEDSIALVGFQYVDWQFDGEDIIYLARVAYDGAHNYHDANRITFHRIENFRDLL